MSSAIGGTSASRNATHVDVLWRKFPRFLIDSYRNLKSLVILILDVSFDWKKTEALDRRQECLNCVFPCVWKQFFGCEEIRLSRCSKLTSVFGKLAYWACWMHVLRKLLTESGFLFRNEVKKHVIPIYFSKDNKTSHSSDGFPPCQQNKRTLKKWQKL